MSRTIRFIILIFVFVASLAGFYIYLKNQQSPTSSVINAIPINTAMIIELKEPFEFFEKLDDKNQIWNAICSLESKNDLKETKAAFDSLLFNQTIAQNLQGQSFVISFHETSKNKFSTLYLSKFENKQEAGETLDYLKNILSKKGIIENRRYSQNKIFTFIPNNQNKKKIFFSFTRGVFLISFNEILLQDAIRQTDSEINLFSQDDFNAIINTSGQNVDANVYIQFKYFEDLLHLAINRSFFKSLGIATFGNWGALDLNLKNQTLLMNGFSSDENKAEDFSQLFKDQLPVSLKFTKHVPVGIEGFTAFGISDMLNYRKNLKNYMEANGELERFLINERHLISSFGKEMVPKLNKIFNKELVHIVQPDGSSFFLIKTTGNNDAKEFVEYCLRNYAAKQQVSFNYLQKEYTVDKETKFLVYKVPVDYLPTRLFGPWFKRAKAEYLAFFDDYIVFGDTYKGVTQFIYNNVLQKTLSYDKEYQQFENYLSSKVNFYSYVSLTGNGNIFSKALNKKTINFYNKNQEAIRDFYALGWQFSKEEDYLYNNVLFRLQPSDKLKAATEWESRLDTLIGIKPVLVRNHYTKEKEIFIQDLKNTVYLVNNSGRILWRKNIDEPIMGEVVQVDYYKNGKLQYLFNTQNKLHLIDRNGNFVERYPIKLPDKAVAPLAVFDYDKRKNYRIFVPFNNKKVIAYSIDGKVVTGFKFKGADNAIISPIQYFRVNNKDYIIITDESRTYITDRRGKIRVNLQKQFDPSPNNEYILQRGNNLRKSRLVRTSTDGTLYYVYFDGSVEQKLIESYSKNHYFNLTDLTGDRVADFIFLDEKELTVYNLSGKEIFDFEFLSDIKLSPAFYKFSADDIYIGVTDSKNRKIYLINRKGGKLDGFPLPGKTQFSIGVLTPGSGRFNLIVGGDNQYLYNYKLN